MGFPRESKMPFAASRRRAKDHDLIVLGSGGAGMAAALFGAIDGLRVLLIEKTEYLGGATAQSGGVAWIPNTHLSGSVGADDNRENAATYLRRVVGNHAPEALHRTFIENGPKAVEKLWNHSEVRFHAFPYLPDHHSDLDGAATAGRALEALPFDGRLLAKDFELLRAPAPEQTVLGGMMVDGNDIGHLRKMAWSWASFRHGLRLLLRHARDRVWHKRGTRLLMGNALVARLLYSLRKRGVEIWTCTNLDNLIVEDGRVAGVAVERAGAKRSLRARRGVVLATGGFNRHPLLRSQLLPPAAVHTPGAPGNTGEAIELALKSGARLGTGNFDNALWAPVSMRQGSDGEGIVLNTDRGKPGTLVVNQAGKRFLNETLSGHLFGHAMVEADRASPCIPAFLIADQRALRKYGLGTARPGGRGTRRLIDQGFLVEAPTIGELARKLGMDPAALERTVSQMNAYAAEGVDPEFGRGATLYQRNLGDLSHKPNPTMGPIDQPPFYALRLFPGDIGASTGLVTDEKARVLADNNLPIPGLYAVGNDMNSIMGGTDPAPGSVLGPAITFAYLAAGDAAQGGA
jgi:succinate dehydrogenase/fumarate reductase flavoprotein subunit